MTRLVLVRHEETPPNRDLARLSGHELFYASSGSDRSVRLTRRGRRRAVALGKLFETMTFSRAYASQFARTRQMLPLLRKTNTTIPRPRIDPRLNKREYGLFWNLTYLGVQRLHPQEFLKYREQGAAKYRPPGGENYDDLFARVRSFMDDELADAEGNVLVATHSAVVLAFAKWIEGLSDDEVVRRYDEQSVPNGHVVVYERQKGDWKPA